MNATTEAKIAIISPNVSILIGMDEEGNPTIDAEVSRSDEELCFESCEIR
jgi:hypothetical protein